MSVDVQLCISTIYYSHLQILYVTECVFACESLCMNGNSKQEEDGNWQTLFGCLDHHCRVTRYHRNNAVVIYCDFHGALESN